MQKTKETVVNILFIAHTILIMETCFCHAIKKIFNCDFFSLNSGI